MGAHVGEKSCMVMALQGGQTEWRNSDGRSSGIILVAAGTVGRALASAGSPAAIALGCCTGLPDMLLVSLY